MKPLAGCRVVDLGIITAGAATAAMLADLGAEVIKVESPSYHDPFRLWSPGVAAPSGRGVLPFFPFTNRNKRAISIDLKSESGKAAFLRLVARSHVVLENFRRGALQGLGLDYAQLRKVNPDIIMASISSQGETGPEAGYVSYGSTLEAVGGLAWRTGYADGQPVITGADINFPDQVVAIYSTGMIATAWHARQNGAGGAHLDLSQRELTSFLSGEAFLPVDSGEEAPRTGNAQAPHLLQDCFRASDGLWIAVTVDPAMLNSLQVLAPAAQDPHSSHAALAAWVAGRPARTSVEQLRAAGIAAALACNGVQVLEERGKGWSYGVTALPDGEVVKGFPFQLDTTPLRVESTAPAVGANTREVLAEIAGYSADEITAMAKAGIIEIHPAE